VWQPGRDLWGPQQFKVFLDDVEIGATDGSSFPVPAPLADGAHRWRVDAIDRRGQVVPMADRLLQVDTVGPVVALRALGRRRAGETVRVVVTASDASGAGVKSTRVDFGDGSPVMAGRRPEHAYSRKGSYTVTARVTDEAGNVGRATLALRIAKRRKAR